MNLKEQAEYYRDLYRVNAISREQAKEMIQPYLNLVNEKYKEIAKKYNQKAKFASFISYVR
jgi:hypothetical protein